MKRPRPIGVMGIPRWLINLILVGQMYAFLVVFIVVLTIDPWWRMLLWLIAGVGIQAGMLLLAALTDPRRADRWR